MVMLLVITESNQPIYGREVLYILSRHMFGESRVPAYGPSAKRRRYRQKAEQRREKRRWRVYGSRTQKR